MSRRVWFITTTLLVFAIIGESAARLAPPPDPTQPATGDAAEIMLHGDPYLLWQLQPGDREERERHVHVNALGFRDKDRGPKQRARVLSLGDSSVYGFGVADEAVFTSRLEAALPADFVNGACPGYSTYQALNLLDMRGLALDPDVLLVATLWSDNNFDSFVDRDLLTTYAGWQASRAGVTRAILQHSELFRWLDWTFRVAPRGRHARTIGWDIGSNEGRTGFRRVAINDYAANLDGMADRMLARGGGVVFVILANRQDLVGSIGGPAWAPYRAVMRDTAIRYGAPIIDLPSVFLDSGHTADALFLDEMHPSSVGHQMLADAVAERLTELGWPVTPLRVHPPTGPRPEYTDPFEGKGIVKVRP